MTRVVIIGAGPYGLSVAAHLRAHGVAFRIFGAPLDSWRNHMPVGMMLKSDGFASSLSHPGGEGTLARYCAERGIAYHDTDIPVSLELFIAYASDFQQRFVGDLEERQVVSLDRNRDGFVLALDDGEVLTADYVVGAFGISYCAGRQAQHAQVHPGPRSGAAQSVAADTQPLVRPGPVTPTVAVREVPRCLPLSAGRHPTEPHPDGPGTSDTGDDAAQAGGRRRCDARHEHRACQCTGRSGPAGAPVAGR